MYIPNLETLKRVIKGLRRYPSSPNMPSCEPVVEPIKRNEQKTLKGLQVFYWLLIWMGIDIVGT